jgi:hypothetical protein
MDVFSSIYFVHNFNRTHLIHNLHIFIQASARIQGIFLYSKIIFLYTQYINVRAIELILFS